jgi:dihydroceramidase
MQLVDELSMIYTTCLMFWATFAHKRAQPLPTLLGIGMVGLAVFITLYYHYLQDPTFHQNAYALLTAIVLLRSMYIMETSIRPYYRQKKAAREAVKSTTETEKREQQRQDDRDREILRKMWWMIGFGLASFLGGFAVWNLDNEYCGWLRKTRHEIGLPWGILLEGHGWWHLGTGLGAFHYITWGVWLRHCLNGRQDEFEMIWPTLFSIPVCVKKESVNGVKKEGVNGKANGRVKGS